MRPIPSMILSFLLMSLCALCAWQWHRERLLRDRADALRAHLDKLTSERDDLDQRVQTANSEILRLTGVVEKLRTESISSDEYQAAQEKITSLTAQLATQNQTLVQQNEAIKKANDVIRQQNEEIKKVATERDRAVQRAHEQARQRRSKE